MNLQIKICGITRREDLECVIRAGADYAGFVAVGHSKRFVPPEQIRALARAAANRIRTVLVAADMPLDQLRKLFAESSCDLLQLHGHESPLYCRNFDPARLWKALRPEDDPACYAGVAARFVCDGAHPGSGEKSDFARARRIAEDFPVMLAGGVARDNLAEVCAIPKLCGLDLASSVESAPGIKSPELIAQFFTTIRRIAS